MSKSAIGHEAAAREHLAAGSYGRVASADSGRAMPFYSCYHNLWRCKVSAKKLYCIVSANEIEETFLLAPPGKDFDVYTVAHLKRVR